MLDKIASIKWWLIGGAALIAVASVGAFTIHNNAYNKGLAVSALEISQYETKVRDLGLQLTEAQGKVTTVIQTEYLDRVVERERIVYRNRDIIIDRVPEQYILSQGWVYAHDESARGNEIDPDFAANAFPSGVSDVEALNLVTGNYAVCAANSDQLAALQRWLTEQKRIHDETIANR